MNTLNNRFLFLTFVLLLYSCLLKANFNQDSLSFKNKSDKFKTGFAIGVNTLDFRLETTSSEEYNYIIKEGKKSIGFEIGLFFDYKLNNSIHIHSTPGFVLGSRQFKFLPKENGEPFVSNIESSFINFPLDVIFFITQKKNLFLLIGSSFKYDLSASRKLDIANNEFVKLKNVDYNLELGVGLDFFIKGITITTKIKTSIGFINVYGNTAEEVIDFLNTGLESLNSRVYSISFCFR